MADDNDNTNGDGESPAKIGFMRSLGEITDPSDASHSTVTPKGKEVPKGVRIIGNKTAAEILRASEDEGIKKRLESEGIKTGAPASTDDPGNVDDSEGGRLKVTHEAPPVAPITTTTPPKPAAAPAPTEPKKDEDQEFIDALDDTQRRVLDFYGRAETAAERSEDIPEKFKGSRKKWIAYYKELDALVTKVTKDDPDAQIDDNEEIQEFVKDKQPEFGEEEIATAKDEILIQKTEDRVNKQHDERFNQIEKAPIVKKAAGEFSESVFDVLKKTDDKALKEIIDIMAKKGGQAGVDAATEEFPEETKVIMNVYNRTNLEAETLIQLRQGLVPFDNANQLHVDVGNAVIDYENIMLQDDHKKHQVVDTKQFVGQQAFGKMSAEDRAKHWTFTTDQILSFMRKDAVNNSITAVHEERSSQQKLINRTLKRQGIEAEVKLVEEKPATDDAREDAGDSASASGGRAGGSGGAGNEQGKTATPYLSAYGKD